MTTAPRWFLALLLVALALPDAAVARTPPATPSPEAIDAAVRATIARYQLPGIAVRLIALLANGLAPPTLLDNGIHGVKLNALRNGPFDKRGAGSRIHDKRGCAPRNWNGCASSPA